MFDALERLNPEQRAAVRPEQPVRRRMEGSAPDAREAAASARGAGQHLARGSAREREEQDPLGRDAAVHEPGYPACERPRLPRAGAGNDQEGATDVLDGRALLGVEAFQGIEHAFEQDRGPDRRGQGPSDQVRSVAA